MNFKSIIPILALFVLTLSVTSLPGLVNGDPVPTNGTSPATQWIPAGPASDTIRFQMYGSDSLELNAMCVGQASTCVPQLDLSDVPIPGSALSTASGCTANCAINDPRFWVTSATPQLGQLQIDFNHAATFWGVTFCNGQDLVTAGAVVCPDAPGGGNIAATCPGATPANDCTTAARNVRQGMAALIDKVAFTIADEGNIGPNAIPMDNPLTPASNVLHSGYPNDINHPNVPPGTCDSTGTNAGCNPVGPYCITPGATGSLSNGPGNQAVACSTAGSIPLGGVCSWDAILGCTTTPISAFHYAADTTDSLGFVNIGQTDFCNAANHFIAAGLATGKNANCELTGESAALSGGTIVFYGRNSLGRHNISVGLAAAICELVALGAVTCPEVSLTIISLAQAHPLVFTTGCKSATEPGCTTVGPNTGWNMYAGGFFFATPTPNDQFGLYNGAFASDFCGGQPGLEPANYDFICNTKHDTYTSQSQFLSTPAAAEASLQVAMDIFGNHTYTIPVWTPSVQYPIVKGWQGISNAAGIGTAQGNTWSLLNAWSANPAVAGPTIRWGQKDATSTLNPFNFNTVVEADIFGEVYDSLLVTNPFSPTQIVGYMVNSYKLETNAQDPACPATYANARGTFTVGACVKMVMRGDIPWQDIYSCAASDAVCLTSHTVTASDVKFSFANYNATGGLITSSTVNTIDVLYNPNQLPSSAYSQSGGAAGAGVSETYYILLHSLNAWALTDIAGVPILPQRLWVTQTAPVQTNGVFAPCTTLGTLSCTVDPAFTGGATSDPILAHKFIGSGAWACASGPLGASGTVYGTGCTFNADGSAGSQAVPVGGTAILRRFSTTNGLDPNLAYFRSNAKFRQFQYAAFPGTTAASTSGIISAINSCKASATAIGGVIAYAACQHWNSKDAGLFCSATAGACIGVAAGGTGGLPGSFGPVVTQIGQWIGKGQWAFGVPSFAALAGAQPIPQTLYEDGSAEGSFIVSSSSATVATTVGTPASVTIQVSSSGGPDNNFTGTVAVTLATVQTSGLTAGLGTSTVTISPGVPTATTTLTVSAAAAGTYTVIVKASSTGFPAVTVTITVTVT
jgi:hypothetical protein